MVSLQIHERRIRIDLRDLTGHQTVRLKAAIQRTD